MLRVLLISSFAASVPMGCAAEVDDDDMGGIPPSPDGGDDDVTGDNTGDGGFDGGDEVLDVGSGDGGGDGGGDSDACPCEDVMDGIYVLNTNTPPSVWFFDPPANTFSEIGVLGCSPPAGFTANSMAIDRAGNAWINYYDQAASQGKIYTAPLSDLGQCEETAYQNPGQAWWLLGMGYAVTDPDSSCDELFLYKSDRYLEYPNFEPGGSHLGQFDEVNEQVSVIGETDYPVAELTGTGDGRLFGFAAVDSSSAVLVNFDKATATVNEKTDLNIDITNAFAFGFWGGDVYMFTETAPLSGTSKVTRLDYDQNEGGGLSEYNPDTGIHIAGAGVSTCASYVPPE